MSKKEEKPKEEEKKDPKLSSKDAKDAKDPKGGDKPAEGAEGEAAEGEEGAPKKSKKKLIIIIVAAVVVIGGVVGGLFAAGILGGGGDAKKVELGKDGKPLPAKDKKELVDKDGKPLPLDKDGNPIKEAPVYFDMPDLIVNLNSPSPRPHFVNLKLTLELANKDGVKTVTDQLPRITDSFNTYLREVRREDLEGSAGTYRLKQELGQRLDKILGPGVVNDILFKEMIVQ